MKKTLLGLFAALALFSFVAPARAEGDTAEKPAETTPKKEKKGKKKKAKEGAEGGEAGGDAAKK